VEHRMLSGDAPIEQPEQDLLGFRAFTDALAAGLAERVPDDGFVVGLQARWGMGKTSAVNLTLAAIRNKVDALGPKASFVIQHFNPWFYSGVQALTEGYLSALGDGIEQAISTGDGRVRRVWRGVKGWAGRVPSQAEVIGASVAGAATVLSAGAAAPLSGAVKSTVVNALRRSQSPDLAKRFRKLMARLNAMRGRVIIVVDDLDRLEPADLRQVMTLIKTFGNLPRVTHLLVYDRDIVDAAVADPRIEPLGRLLPTYREKIVQAEFDLPNATEQGLKSIISREVDPLIRDEPDFDQMDWFYAAGLAISYLRSPRDVVRFTNGLSVTWPSVAGEGYFPDLFVIELWRLFERPLYDAIRDHKAVVTGDRLSLSISENERARVVDYIVNQVPLLRRDSVLRMIRQFFPELAKQLPDKLSSWGGSTVSDRRRIGSPLGFDTYFRLVPPEGEYSMQEKRALHAALRDEAALRSAFSDARSRQLPDGQGSFLRKLLDALIEILGGAADLGVSPLPALNVVLAEAEDVLDRARTEQIFDWWWGRPQVARIVRDLLGRLPAVDRLAALQNALAGAGLSARAVVIIAQYQPHNSKFDANERERLDDSVLAAGEAEGLANDFVADLERDPDRILASSAPWQTISLWNERRGPAPVKAWIDGHLAEPAMVVMLADMVMTHVRSTAGEYRELKERVDLEYYNLREISEAAKALVARNAFDAKDRPLIDAFIRDASRQLEREAKGDVENDEGPDEDNK